MKRFTSLVTLMICLTASAAQAALLPGYSAGIGSNTSHLIIDFGFNSGDAYLFDYHYDGTKTGEDMLLALNTAGPLVVDHQFFNFGGSNTIFTNGFSFNGESSIPVFEGANGESWTYWGSAAAPQAPGDWTFFNTFGPTDRVLSNGSYDGFYLNISPFNSQGLPATTNPPATVPEPGSMLALASAGLLLVRRRSA